MCSYVTRNYSIPNLYCEKLIFESNGTAQWSYIIWRGGAVKKMDLISKNLMAPLYFLAFRVTISFYL